jgi:hypothetical protein
LAISVILQVVSHSLICGSDVVALQVVDVAFEVHKELFFFTIYLDSTQSTSCQVLRVIDVDDILIPLFIIV